MSDLIGKNIGKYRVVGFLGRGGMAEVYEAYHAALDRRVAIKVIHSHLADDRDFIERFEREATAIARLRHANIVQVYDFDLEDDMYYMVLEFVAGATLEDEMKSRAEQGQGFTLEETVRMFSALSSAIDYAHEQGIVHRDLKPANIMFTAEGQLILMDFGIAHLMEANKETIAGGGAIVGTPAYMSPEQAQGDIIDGRSDIYTLGVILYELVTGRVPFEAENAFNMMMQHVMAPPPPPTKYNPNILPALEAVVLKPLSKDPAERYETATQMTNELREAVGLTAEQLLALAPVPASLSVSLTTVAQPETATTGALEALARPPEPAPLPKVGEFVGREKELAAFSNQLQNNHLAVITGMSGIGKTTFAALLAEMWQVKAGASAKKAVTQPVFWHTFYAGEGIESITWKMAAFLGWNGQLELWQMLQSAQENGGQAPPTDVLLDYIFQMLAENDYLLVFDDFHFMDGDSQLAQFIERLQRAVSAGEISLILISQRPPEFDGANKFEPLNGLSLAETATLLDAWDIALPFDLITDLHRQTGGLPQFLMLAITALNSGNHPNPARLINRLLETDNIERYLLKQFDDNLNDEEQEVMKAVAVLLGYPGTRDAIEAVLDGESVRRPLRDLSDRYILTVSKGEMGREYSLNAMVQAFYYDLLGRSERRAMHRLAGEFYQVEEPDNLKAALHYEQAREFELAAQLATADVRGLINKGQARPLRNLLERFNKRKVNQTQWLNINIALGELYALENATQQAQDYFDEALSVADNLPAGPQSQNIQADICRHLAKLYEAQGIYNTALEWVQRGLDILGQSKNGISAQLHYVAGIVHTRQGRYEQAWQECQQSLHEAQQEKDLWVEAQAYTLMGHITRLRGDSLKGVDYFEQALNIYKKLNDISHQGIVYNALAVAYWNLSRWPQAEDYYRQAHRIFSQTGRALECARVNNNLGYLILDQGRVDEAIDFFTAGLAALEEIDGTLRLKALMQMNLGYAYIRQGRAKQAVDHLQQSKGYIEQSQDRDFLPELHRYFAECALLQDDIAAAGAEIETSLSLAKELAMQTEIAKTQRVYAQVLAQQGNPSEAETMLTESIQVLGALGDEYEQARSQLVLARLYLNQNNPIEGKALAQQSLTVFERLGAKLELELAQGIVEEG